MPPLVKERGVLKFYLAGVLKIRLTYAPPQLSNLLYTTHSVVLAHLVAPKLTLSTVCTLFSSLPPPLFQDTHILCLSPRQLLESFICASRDFAPETATQLFFCFISVCVNRVEKEVF